MTSAIDYADATHQATTAFATTLDSWGNNVTAVTDRFRAFPAVSTLPTIDVTQAVERQFALIQQVVDLNHRYARQLAEVVNTLTGVAREQLESVSGVVSDQLETVSAVARKGVDAVEQTVSEQAERRQARAAAKAEREEREAAEEKARAPYADLTKAELSELAAKRNLPKTGTVDELVARLVEADAE